MASSQPIWSGGATLQYRRVPRSILPRSQIRETGNFPQLTWLGSEFAPGSSSHEYITIGAGRSAATWLLRPPLFALQLDGQQSDYRSYGNLQEQNLVKRQILKLFLMGEFMSYNKSGKGQGGILAQSFPPFLQQSISVIPLIVPLTFSMNQLKYAFYQSISGWVLNL